MKQSLVWLQKFAIIHFNSVFVPLFIFAQRCTTKYTLKTFSYENYAVLKQYFLIEVCNQIEEKFIFGLPMCLRVSDICVKPKRICVVCVLHISLTFAQI